MNTPPAPSVQSALRAELGRIVELDRVIRAAQAEQFQRIEAARVLAASLEGVTELSGSAEREFAARSFVSELATTMTVHEATASRLVGDAGRLAGRFAVTLAALAGGAICVGKARTILELASTLPTRAVAEFEQTALRHPLPETPSAFRGGFGGYVSECTPSRSRPGTGLRVPSGGSASTLPTTAWRG